MPRIIDADEAYKVLADYYHIRTEIQHKALKEAMERVPTVDAEPNAIESLPTIDAVEVVRCKDCIHYWKNDWKNEPSDDVAVCLASPKDDAFCSEGERKEDARLDELGEEMISKYCPNRGARMDEVEE